jgi:hypothetical protein
MTRTRGSSTSARTLAVPSVDPSSTTTTSATQGDPSTRSTSAATVAASLKHGMATDRQRRGVTE